MIVLVGHVKTEVPALICSTTLTVHAQWDSPEETVVLVSAPQLSEIESVSVVLRTPETISCAFSGLPVRICSSSSTRYTPRTREKRKIADAGILSSLSGSRLTSSATTHANNVTLR